MAINLQALSDEIGETYLLDILEALGLQAKDEYEDSDPELAKIRDLRSHMKTIGSKSVANAAASYGQNEQQAKTTKRNSKATGAAIAKAEQATAKGKGALVQGAQKAATAAITQAAKQGRQLGDQANRQMATSFLETRSEGMELLASSIDDGSDAIAAISEEVFVNFGGEASEDFLPASGGFSLL